MDSFFSCKYAVASNPIRIRLKFSGHKFTIIYSHLDVIKEERKNTSDPYGITQLLYTIVPSHIIPLFFHSIPSPQKIVQPHYNKNSQCGFHHIAATNKKGCHLGFRLRKLPPSLIKSTPVHLAAHLIAVTKIPCAAGRSTP